MADNGRDVEIRIRGTLSPEGFKQARVELKGLRDEADRMAGSGENLERKLRGAGRGAGDLGATFGRLTAAFSVASLINNVASSLANFGREAIADAGALVDLSLKTGASIEWLQRASFVAKQTGSDVSTWTQAMFKLGVNVSKGTTDVKQALHDLGFEWQKFKQLKQEEQMDQIAAALAKVENLQDRNRMSVVLMGKGVGEVIPGMVDNYDQLRKAAVVASDAQVKALDRAGDAWDAFLERQKRGLQSALGTLVLASDEIGKKGLLATYLEGNDAANKLSPGSRLMLGPTGILSFMLTAAAGHRAAADAAAEHGKAVKEKTEPAVASLKEQLKATTAAMNNLTAEQRANIQAGITLNKNTEEISNETGVAAEVIDLYKDRLQSLKSSTKSAADEQRRLQESIDDLASSVQDLSLWEMAQVEAALKAGKSQEDIAKAYGLTKQQVHDLAAAEKGLGEIRKAQEDLKKRGDAEALDAAREQAHRLTEITLDRLKEEQKAEEEAAIEIGATRARLQHDAEERADDEMQRYFRQLEDWDRQTKQSLSTASRQFERLAIIGGGSLSTIAKGFGLGITLADQFKSSMDAINDSVQTFADGQTRVDWAGMVAGYVGMVNALTDGSRALSDYLNRHLYDEIQALKAEIRSFRGTPLTAQQYFDQHGTGLFSDAEGRRGGPGVRYREALREQDEALRELRRIEADRDKAVDMRQRNVLAVGSIFDRVLDLGDRLPDSIRGAVDEMVRMNEVSAETRDRLFGLDDGPDWRTMQQLAEKYDVELSALGKDFQQDKVADTAIELGKALMLMITPGADVGRVLHGMSDEISEVVQNARRAHVDLPETFRPWVQQLIDAGELLDENGNKITDLSGLTFSESLTDGLHGFVDELRQILRDMGLLKDEARDFAKDPAYLANVARKGTDFGVSRPHIYIGEGAGTEKIPRFNREMEIVTRPGLGYLDPGDYVGMPRGRGASDSGLVDAVQKLTVAITSGSGGKVEMHLHGTIIDGDSLRRFILDKFGPAFANELTRSGRLRGQINEALA